MNLGNPDVAENVVNKRRDAIDTSEDLSERGMPLFFVAEVESDFRFVLSGNYMVFYRMEAKTVQVDRVLYQGRNYLSVLFGDLSE